MTSAKGDMSTLVVSSLIVERKHPRLFFPRNGFHEKKNQLHLNPSYIIEKLIKKPSKSDMLMGKPKIQYRPENLEVP